MGVMSRMKPVSYGLVVVRCKPGADCRYLLLRAYKNWDFPKGRPEPGESALETAVRELREETSLEDLEFKWGYELAETEPYGQGKVACFFVAESPEGQVSLPVSAELGVPEHHEFRWATYEEARRLLPERLTKILDWAQSKIALKSSR